MFVHHYLAIVVMQSLFTIRYLAITIWPSLFSHRCHCRCLKISHCNGHLKSNALVNRCTGQSRSVAAVKRSDLHAQCANRSNFPVQIYDIYSPEFNQYIFASALAFVHPSIHPSIHPPTHSPIHRVPKPSIHPSIRRMHTRSRVIGELFPEPEPDLKWLHKYYPIEDNHNQCVIAVGAGGGSVVPLLVQVRAIAIPCRRLIILMSIETTKAPHKFS